MSLSLISLVTFTLLWGLASQPKGKRQEGSSPSTSCVESTFCSQKERGSAVRARGSGPALGLSRCLPDSGTCSEVPPKVECSLPHNSALEAGSGMPRRHGLAASPKRDLHKLALHTQERTARVHHWGHASIVPVFRGPLRSRLHDL